MQDAIKRLSVSFPPKLFEHIEDFRHERRYSSITKSVEELCRIALTFVEGKENVDYRSDLSKEELRLVECFNRLNQQGRHVALRTLADLSEVSYYKSSDNNDNKLTVDG